MARSFFEKLQADSASCQALLSTSLTKYYQISEIILEYFVAGNIFSFKMILQVKII